MADPPALVRAVSELAVPERISLTLEDASEIESMVTLAPSYNPHDPSRQTQGYLQVKCVATRESYDEFEFPSAELVIDAIERRRFEPPVVSVHDPKREPAGTGQRARPPESLTKTTELTRIVEDRWKVLGELIGIDYRN